MLNSLKKIFESFGFQNSREILGDKLQIMKQLIDQDKVVGFFQNGFLEIHFSNSCKDRLKRWENQGISLEAPIKLEMINNAHKAVEYFSSGDLDYLMIEDQMLELPNLALQINQAIEAGSECIYLHANSIADCDDAFVLNMMGKYWAFDKEISKAGEAFRRSIETCPSFSEPYSNLGTLMWQAGKSKEAFLLFCEGMLKNPHTLASQLNFFDSGYELKEYKAMITILDVVIKEVEDSSEFFHHLALCHFKLDNKEEAVRILDEILKTYPNDVEAKEMRDVFNQSLIASGASL